MFNADTYKSCYDCYNKTISPLGYDISRTATHVIRETMTLNYGSKSKIIYKKDRDYSSYMTFKRRGQGIAFEVWTVNKHITNFFDGVIINGYTGNLTDTIKSELHSIVYMDLRNDILITEDRTNEVTIFGGAAEAPALIESGQYPFMYSFVKFPNTNITQTRNVRASDTIINNSTPTYNEVNTQYSRKIAIDNTPGFVWDIRISELESGGYKAWEKYYYDGLLNPEHDGNDYYRPFWQQDATVWATLDNALDVAYRDAIPGNNYPAYDIYYTPIAAIYGSAAVDSLKNILISYKDGNNSSVNMLKDAKGNLIDPFKDTGLLGNTLYPISPVGV